MTGRSSVKDIITESFIELLKEKSIDDIYAKVDAKKKELEDAATGKAKQAVDDAKSKATDAAKSKLKSLF